MDTVNTTKNSTTTTNNGGGGGVVVVVPLLVVGLSQDSKRVLQRARDADIVLHDLWNLNPIVGGISEAKPPKLICFSSVREALMWIKSKDLLTARLTNNSSISSNNNLNESLLVDEESNRHHRSGGGDDDDVKKMAIVKEAHHMIRKAKLSHWRVNDPAPDQELFRLPSFARHEFDLVVSLDEWLG
jgi:hypothetical protein